MTRSALRLLRRRGELLAAASSLGVVSIASLASAHLGHVVTRAERYLKIDASDAETRVVVSLMLAAEEGERVLRAADGNGDGVVDAGERDAYLAQWGEGLRTELPLTLDGVSTPLAFAEGFLDPIGVVRPVPVVAEMTARIPTLHREHVIELGDAMRRETFDRTDVAFRAHDGASLVASGRGPQRPLADGATDIALRIAEPERDVSYGALLRDPGPDSLVMIVRYPSHPEASALPTWMPWAVAPVLLLPVVLSVARRRRRR